ncbi:hypothetical protein [Longimicrobium sp.]|uniref:hypothetical protein n=1 Tax=Longimicrobium sp. TaxID=2029185 RepID=UPI003B3B99D6
MKKLRLRVENLQVESFGTSAARRGPGTVVGRGEDCTWMDSCLCDTAYYWCGTGMETIHSCDYTNNELCERTAVDCPNTNYQVCGTRQETPGC